MKILKNHVAIVSGGGAGLGLAIAKRFLGSGAKVFLNDLSKENLSKASSLLIGSGINPKMFDSLAGDISKETDVETLFKTCLARFGPCTILVNNAGIIQEKSFHKISNEDWDKMISVHLRGCFLSCKNATI